ncbi:MAG: cellulase family glycosylhydrolase [Chitinispirillia bacterium]|nr:cellulase family glycosylhydrolase [Chitinispirillia bacterium]
MIRIRLFVTILAVTAIAAFAGPVEQYGRLMAAGDRIVGEKSGGEAVQLKGPSLYWSHSAWSGKAFFVTEAVDAMIDGWGAQVIRFPLGINENYPDRDDGGYDSDPEGNWERLERVVDHAVSRGVYVVVDWHSHNAHEPDITAKAVDFFTNPERAGKYGSNPAVIFEIYNEPTKTAASSWASEVKPYAETVIGAIRAAGFNNLILVGNPAWTSMPNVAAANPPVDPNGTPFDNMAMSFHFYADSHRLGRTHYFQTGTYRDAILNTLSSGYPIFVSEWGTNDATDQGVYNFPQTDLWHSFLDSLKISSCAWAAAVTGTVLDYWNRWTNPLSFGAETLANWTNPDNMTPHGRYIYHWLTGNDTTVTTSGDGWPAFTGLRSQIPLVRSGNWSPEAANTATTLSWDVSEDSILNIKFKLNKGTLSYSPYAGIALTGSVSRCEWGIGYTYKGSKHTLRPEQSDINDATGWDYHHNSMPTNTVADWTTVRIPWAYFQQIGWGNPVAQDRTKVTNIRWYVGYLEANDGDEGEIWVKDVWCLGDPGGEVASVRNPGRQQAASVNQYVNVSGKTLQVRLIDDAKVDVFNMSGKRMRTMNLKQGDHNIRMNDLPRGMYIVKVNGKAAARMQPVKMLVK